MLNRRIDQQLKLMASDFPATQFVSISSVDGLKVAEYYPNEPRGYPEQEERGFSPISAVMSLGERILSELVDDDFHVGVIRGTGITVFHISINGEYIFLLGLREVQSIDAVLWVLRQRSQPMIKMLEDGSWSNT